MRYILYRHPIHMSPSTPIKILEIGLILLKRCNCRAEPRKRKIPTSVIDMFLGCVFSRMEKTLDLLPGYVYGSCVNTADYCGLCSRHERVLEARLFVTTSLYDIHYIDTCDYRLLSILSYDSIIAQLDSQVRLSNGVEIPCSLHVVTTRRSSVSCFGFSKQGSPERFQLARL